MRHRYPSASMAAVVGSAGFNPVAGMGDVYCVVGDGPTVLLAVV